MWFLLLACVTTGSRHDSGSAESAATPWTPPSKGGDLVAAWGHVPLDRVDEDGFHLGELRFRLSGWGRSAQPIAPAPVTPRVEANRTVRRWRGVEEWWRTHEDVYEQGWTLTSPPPGVGPLTIVVSIEGATPVPAGAGALLLTTAGELWRYDDLAAYDADGVELPATLRVHNDQILVEVNDRGARYPIVVDPTLSVAPHSISGYGNLVEPAGDVNGDGYGDLIVASCTAGTVSVFLGGPIVVQTTPVTSLSGLTADRFGCAVAGAGDVDADGYDDVVVGASNRSAGAGAIDLFRGGVAGVGAVATQTIAGAAGARLGRGVGGVGDIDGDGRDDVAASGFRSGLWYNYVDLSVFDGDPLGLDPVASWSVTLPLYFALDVGFVRPFDVHGDGRPDLGFSVAYEPSYLFENSAAGLSTSPDFSAFGLDAGDFNGDGRDDIITESGYVYTGSASGVGALSDRLSGVADAWVLGDTDGDGFEDVGAEANGYCGSDTYSFSGSASWLPTSGNVDPATVAVGDLNGDGLDDGAAVSGSAVDIHYGRSDRDGDGWKAGGPAVFGLDCDDSDAAVYPSATDVSGDGIDADCDGVDGAPAGTAAPVCPEFTTLAEARTTVTSPFTTLGDPAEPLRDAWDQGEALGCVSNTTGSAFATCELAVDGLDLDGASLTDLTRANPLYCTGSPVSTSSGSVSTWAFSTTLPTGSDPESGVLWRRESVNQDGFLSSYGPWGSSYYERLRFSRGRSDEGWLTYADGSVAPFEVTQGYSLEQRSGGWLFGTYTEYSWSTAFSLGACDVTGTIAADSSAPSFSARVDDGVHLATVDYYWGMSVCGQPLTDLIGYPGALTYGVAELDGVASLVSLSTWTVPGTDADNDGWPVSVGSGGSRVVDCDDAAADVNPCGQEVCGSADEDCDGLVDDDDPDVLATTVWYEDADGDGHGDLAATVLSCGGAGLVSNGDDCDDTRADVSPEATELCDPPGTDEDCDGEVDESDASVTVYADLDGDGYGDPALTATGCVPGYVSNNLDCDDADAATYPGAPELADGLDNNCDGSIDEGTSAYDDDGDGFSEAAGDCDDADVSVAPGLAERCNGLDDNCDGTLDLDAIDRRTSYTDTDADGYGDDSVVFTDCEVPVGATLTGGDCDDSDPARHPGASELDCTDPTDYNCDGSVAYADADLDGAPACQDCDDSDPATYVGAPELADGLDNNCDGTIDEGTTAHDDDGDGFSEAAGDCDDADVSVAPDLDERCNGLDDNCDGTVDLDAIDRQTSYADTDGDGYGDDTVIFTDCEVPVGTTLTGGDCDDSDPARHPGASELDCTDPTDYNCDGSVAYADADLDGAPACQDCDDTDPATYVGALELADGADNNCDGTTDEGTSAYDDDGDGFSEAAGDCDDADVSVAPDLAERCNGLDDNCDGTVDLDATDRRTSYADTDGDGYGDDTVVFTDCEVPVGATVTGGDCDDSDPARHPGASELDCTDPTDYNCDGSVAYADADLDGAPACQDCDDTDPATYVGAPELADGADNNCDGTIDEGTSAYDDDGDGFSEAAGDCDDADVSVAPDLDERCNGLDDNCDGTVDLDAIDRRTSYADTDGDGYGDDSVVFTDCEVPAGATLTGGDCDDSDPARHPDAEELDCADPTDYNCDRSVGYADADLDGAPACQECDDSNPAIAPGLPERCDGLDNDCDGRVDLDAIDAETGYEDADGDGYGVGDPVRSCTPPSADQAGDCDDEDPAVSPEGLDRCSPAGLDEDCDGRVDEDCVDEKAPPAADSCGCGGDGSSAWALMAALLLLRRPREVRR